MITGECIHRNGALPGNLEASRVISCKSERIVGYLFSLERFDRLEVHSLRLKGGYAEWNNLELNCLGTEDSEISFEFALCLE